jgi:hypothetical protein
MRQPAMLRQELEGLKRELGSQARVAHALGRSEEWTSRTLTALARGEQPRLELKTELAIHNLYAFVVFAAKRLGPDVRVWLFVPREEFDHAEPAAVLREGRIHEVIGLLRRERDPGDGDEPDQNAPRLRRSALFQDQPPRLRRVRLGGPRREPISFEELDRRMAGKRLDLEGVIYGRL